MSVLHQLKTDEALKLLETDRNGLTTAEVGVRQEKYGANELQAAARISPWQILFEQFKDVLIVILLLATVFSVFMGQEIEAITIAIIVLFAVGLGFVQEYKAEKAIEALKQMAAPNATVIRDGQEQDIPSRELVPGDIILLKEGNRVPADARLIEAVNIRLIEAALTGESVPVSKVDGPLEAEELPLGERKNMLFAGTSVTYGRGTAVVATTGMQTEFGKIATLLQTVEITRTPLQENLDKVGQALAKASLAIVSVIVLIGLYRGQPLVEMIIFGVALAVAVVPEALPAVVTVSLAVGVQKMVKRHALIRRLPAVETLGSTTYICSDKTGTLTRDEMTVRKVFVAGQLYEFSGAGYSPEGECTTGGKKIEKPDQALEILLRGATLASDAHLIRDEQGQWDIKGDPTEGAMVVAAAKLGIHRDAVTSVHPRIAEIPFSSETKRMTTLHTDRESTIAFSKGAAEIILNSCTKIVTPQGVVPITEALRAQVLDQALLMAKSALRVLALAYKAGVTIEHSEGEMIFVGLLGMIDPPRTEVKASIETCRQAGIKAVMITGDHPVTAEAIARELGLLTDGRIVTGAELDLIDDDAFEKEVENIQVYARVSPAHKLRVVTALQKNGHIVAMTGDGVNDAPALKKANIGIAMGITGTDVSKEAAAMMLTDDNFASIVAAVEEGRGIFGNIKKYLMYLLSSNIGEIGLMTGASLIGLPLPLSAVQILYVNLATDGLPALALAVDPPEQDLMKRPPRDPRTGIFTRPVLSLMLTGGIWSTLVNIGLFSWARSSGRSIEEAMTMTFVSLVLIQFFKAYSFRSDRLSILVRPFANKWLNMAILWEMSLLIAIIYLPVFHRAFGTFSLTGIDWVVILSLAFSIVPVLEFAKYLERRGVFGRMV